MRGRLLARLPSGALELVLCIVPLLCYLACRDGPNNNWPDMAVSMIGD